MSEAVVVVVLAACGFASIVIDIRTRRVPNVLTFGLALTGVGLAALQMTGLSVWNALAGLLLGLALMLPGHVIGATGAGDVKLFAAAGTLLGPVGVVFAFLYTALAGGLLAIIVALARGQLRATLDRLRVLLRTGGATRMAVEQRALNNRFAYAPAIAIGTLAVALGF
jgi:prepilin peptidase CpaA